MSLVIIKTTCLSTDIPCTHSQKQNKTKLLLQDHQVNNEG